MESQPQVAEMLTTYRWLFLMNIPATRLQKGRVHTGSSEPGVRQPWACSSSTQGEEDSIRTGLPELQTSTACSGHRATGPHSTVVALFSVFKTLKIFKEGNGMRVSKHTEPSSLHLHAIPKPLVNQHFLVNIGHISSQLSWTTLTMYINTYVLCKYA